MWPGEGLWKGVKDIGNGFKELGEKLISKDSYQAIGKGLQTLGGMYKDAADKVEVKASGGWVVGAKVGKVGAEVNFGSKELGTASTASGFQKSNNEGVTKGGSISYGVGEIALKAETTTSKSTATYEFIPGFARQTEKTTETTVATATASIAGFGVQSSRTNTTTTLEGFSGESRVQSPREVDFTWGQNATIPQKSFTANNAVFSIAIGIKIDISIK